MEKTHTHDTTNKRALAQPTNKQLGCSHQFARSRHIYGCVITAKIRKRVHPSPPGLGAGLVPASVTTTPPRARPSRARHCLSHSDNRDAAVLAPNPGESAPTTSKATRLPWISASAPGKGRTARTRHEGKMSRQRAATRRAVESERCLAVQPSPRQPHC